MIGSTSSATTVRINDTKKTSSAIVRTSGPLASGASMHPKVPRAQPRKRLRWPEGAPRVGIHLGVDRGLLRAARRARQMGATAIQIFSDNPTAWRRRPEPPPDAAAFVAFCAAEGIAPIAIHASYLIILAATPATVRLVLENSSGGGDTIGSTIEDLARVLDGLRGPTERLAFCLDA